MPTRKRSFSRLVRRLTVLAPLTAVLLLPAGSASAGGPTSVLLVSPETRQTASLYATDADYGLLLKALGEKFELPDDAPSWRAGPGSTDVNVTWLIHDVQVWRIDQIKLSAKGEPWVQTRTTFDGPIDLGASVGWHRPADPGALLGLLEKLGLLDHKTSIGESASITETSSAPVAAGSAAGDPDGWWWLASGLVGGLLIGVAGRPAARALSQLRQRRAHREPRQQLVDLG